MLPRAFSAEYSGLIAAPGTPNAVRDALALQHVDGGVDGSHLGHGFLRTGEGSSPFHGEHRKTYREAR